MDFITDFSLLNNCNLIWVIIDRFTKIAYFILLKKNGKTVDYFIYTFARKY